MKVTNLLFWVQENKLSEKFYNRVDDVDATYEKLIKDGFASVTKPRDWPWGNHEFILKDLGRLQTLFLATDIRPLIF